MCMRCFRDCTCSISDAQLALELTAHTLQAYLRMGHMNSCCSCQRCPTSSAPTRASIPASDRSCTVVQFVVQTTHNGIQQEACTLQHGQKHSLQTLARATALKTTPDLRCPPRIHELIPTYRACQMRDDLETCRCQVWEGARSGACWQMPS